MESISKEDYKDMINPPPCVDCPDEIIAMCGETKYECEKFKKFEEKEGK